MMIGPWTRRTAAASLLVLALGGCLTEHRAREIAQGEAQAFFDTFRGTEVMPSLRELRDKMDRDTARLEAMTRKSSDRVTTLEQSLQDARADLTAARGQFVEIRKELLALRKNLTGHEDLLAALRSRSVSLSADLTRLQQQLGTNLQRDLSTLAETLARLETRGRTPPGNQDLPPAPPSDPGPRARAGDRGAPDRGGK